GAELTGDRKRLAPVEKPSSIDLAAALQWIEKEPEETDESAAKRALATIFHLDDHDDVTGADPRPEAEWGAVYERLGEDTAELLTLVKSHLWMRSLLEETISAKALSDLAAELLDSRSAAAQGFLGHIIAGLSIIRAQQRLAAPTVDVHLWVRALTRIDRIAGGETEFSWSDDEHLITAETE